MDDVKLNKVAIIERCISRIQEEYENFRNHKLFKTQETLVSRFDKLYEFFKIKPNEGIKAEELVGKVLATDLTYYCRAKGTASQSVRRIKEAYEAYRKSKSSDVDFVFTYEHYSLHWIEKRKGLKYLLNVYYKDINYNDILVKYSEGADSGDGITVKVRLDFFPFKLRAFVVEYLRDDNPFEYAWWAIYRGGTVSQNIGIYMVIFGLVLMGVFTAMRPETITIKFGRSK